VELDRSTLAEWVGGSSRLLAPLVEVLRRHVMAAGKLHADDTPVPVLAPGLGKTKTGRLWTYVRDDRPAGDSAPAAVWFAYSPDRKGEHPQSHLSNFTGTLQADAYAGFEQIYEAGRIQEAACWAHVRRKFYDLEVAHKSPTAADALERIAALKHLIAGPERLGYQTPLWTCPRVAHLIEQEFNVRYHEGHVWKILVALGWSPQRPEGRARERNEEQILNWKKNVWPALKKKRAAKGASSSSSTKAD
jgi:hypothetical protein